MMDEECKTCPWYPEYLHTGTCECLEMLKEEDVI